MKSNLILMVLFALFILPACHDDDFWGVRGEGPVVSETREIRTFDRIDLGVSGEVFLRQGSTQEVRIEAQRNILAIMETDVKNGKLEIDFGKHNVRRYSDIKIYITVPEITSLKVSGSGKISGETDFEVFDLDLNISGSGRIDFGALNANSIDTDISGSGDLYLNGDATRHNANISGSGKIKAFELKTENSDIEISGSGNAEVFATSHLKAKVSGSGKVRYKGSPTVDVNISGSGKVENAN
jgi:hypothetical protein